MNIAIITPDPDEPDLDHFRGAAQRANVTIEVVATDHPDLARLTRSVDAALAYVLGPDHLHVYDHVEPHIPIVPGRNTALLRDKWHGYQQLTAANIPTPPTVLLTADTLNTTIEQIGLPAVTKPRGAYGGTGVELVRTAGELHAAHARGAEIAQPLLAGAHGRDVRIVTIGGQVVSRVRRTAADPHEFRSNVKVGGTVQPLPADPRYDQLAVAAAAAADLHVCGVDILEHDGQLWVCEINTAPGFRGAPAAQMADLWLAPVIDAASSSRIS